MHRVLSRRAGMCGYVYQGIQCNISVRRGCEAWCNRRIRKHVHHGGGGVVWRRCTWSTENRRIFGVHREPLQVQGETDDAGEVGCATQLDGTASTAMAEAEAFQQCHPRSSGLQHGLSFEPNSGLAMKHHEKNMDQTMLATRLH